MCVRADLTTVSPDIGEALERAGTLPRLGAGRRLAAEHKETCLLGTA